MISCPLCMGTGKREDGSVCDECSGEGSIEETDRKGNKNQ